MAQNDDVDALLADAAYEQVIPSAALMSRILADADAWQPKPRPALLPVTRRRNWLATLADWFGGGTSLAGMSVAAATGLYLGAVQPLPIMAWAEMVTGSVAVDSMDLLPSSGTLWGQE